MADLSSLNTSLFFTGATCGDSSQLEELERHVFVPSDGLITKRSFNYHIRRGKNLVLVAKLSDMSSELVGYSLVLLHRQSARIYSLAVDPRYQERGIGKGLAHYTLEKIQARGYTNIHLELRQENSRALKLYESLGFVSYRIRHNYYGPAQDAVLMTWRKNTTRLKTRLPSRERVALTELKLNA